MKAYFHTFGSLLLLTIIFSTLSAYGSTLTVTKTEDTNDGACDIDCSLREAVAASASGDSIVFADLFNIPQTITLVNGEIEINKSLTIAGPGSELLTISGNSATRIFLVSSNKEPLTLSGMLLRNARNTASSLGGAIAIFNGTLIVKEMIFRENYVRDASLDGAGPAIWAQDSNVSISNSSFNNNLASFDGATVDGTNGTVAIVNSSFTNNTGWGAVARSINAIDSNFHGNSGTGVGAGHLTLDSCTVTNNRDGGVGAGFSLVIDRSIIAFNERFNSIFQSGGGVYNTGEAVITNTMIANNQVNGDGAGVRNTGTIYFRDSAIVNNTAARDGGAIRNSIGSVYLTNTTVSGNQALRGGGIYNHYDGTNPGAKIFITNSTLAFNRSFAVAGGIVNIQNAVVTTKNSIIAKNTVNADLHDFSGTIVSQGFNLTGPQNGSIGWAGSDLVGVLDPLLSPLGSNGGTTLTHAIYPKSPAINAGSNSLAVDPQTNTPLTTDQRGGKRRIGDNVDIGAYEANYSSAPVSIAGRLITSAGRGIAGGRVALSSPSGETRYAITNPFGHYRFLNLPVGMTYTITGTDKLYKFASPTTLTTDQDREDLIFLGMF